MPVSREESIYYREWAGMRFLRFGVLALTLAACEDVQAAGIGSHLLGLDAFLPRGTYITT